MRVVVRLVFGLLLTAGVSVAEMPKLFLIGDSTVNNGTTGQRGWGQEIAGLFDTNRIQVVNRARGGRSSRTFITEGLWSNVLNEAKSGDFVLMQFGHNDAGSVTNDRARASLRGIGDETLTWAKTNGTTEVVHTYGWYMRRYITDAKAKGMTPIVLSFVPRNDWKDGKVMRGSFVEWAREAAHAEDATFVDLNDIVARHYEELGPEKVKALFPQEHTHTSKEGAALNARCVVEGLKQLKDCPLTNYLAKVSP